MQIPHKTCTCLTQISVRTVIKAITAAKSQPVSERKEPLVIANLTDGNVVYRIEEVEPVREVYQQGLRLLQLNDSSNARTLLEKVVTGSIRI